MNCGKGIVFADWSHHENICEGGSSSYHAPCIDEDQSTSVIIGDSDEELPDNCGNACVTMRDSQSLSIKVDSSHNDSSKLTAIDIEETGQNKDPDNFGKFLCFCVIQQNLNTLISTKIYSAVVQQRCEELGFPYFFRVLIFIHLHSIREWKTVSRPCCKSCVHLLIFSTVHSISNINLEIYSISKCIHSLSQML